ncbi:MAG: sortase [Ruminococcus sp.]|nr:sortase [Ruminococcus sp.]MDE6849137.1 sortase [Ruminococcus sp.]MDE7137692.1 sortase [Ruminococcus sp.]
MNKLGKIMVISGILFILSAVLLCLYNYRESEEAFKNSQVALNELKSLIPEIPEENVSTIEKEFGFEIKSGDNVFDEFDEKYEEEKNMPTEQVEMPSVQLDGRYYCGYITLTSLGIELPVLNGWNYTNLNIAPCCYEGSPQTHDFIIAAHNYNSHFGQIHYLGEGDEIIFTDISGEKYRYTVMYTEYIDGYNADQMSENKDSSWDLTLFTCTLNGQRRVTVRAKLDEKK